MADKLNVMILTAEDSKKVFRMDQQRLEAALQRHPDIANLAEFHTIRTSTRYQNAPGWNAADRDLFYHKVVDMDVILGYMFPLDDFARRARNVRYIHIIDAGVEHLLPLDWLPKGALLTDNRGAHTPKTCEFAMMAMLMLGNHIPRLATAQNQNRWDGHYVTLVEGGTAIIIGAGHQGSAVAEACGRLGIKAIGVDPNVTEKEGFDSIVPLEQLHKVLPLADYVFLTMPATDATLRFFGRREFARMRETAGFVNICRGTVLHTEALLEALQNRLISGAILDVFDHEPLPENSPLWSAPNLILTPHMGCDDEENYIHRTYDIFFDNLRRLVQGETLENVVDPIRGY